MATVSATVIAARWSRPYDWTGPKKLLGVRTSCVVLDSDGRMCLTPAKFRVTVHGNPEWDSRWYAVPMCDAHAKESK
jgi:hypothetical protein